MFKLGFQLGIGTAVIVVLSLFGYTINKQQDTIETMIDRVAMTVEHEQSQEDRIWDLHRRVKALEAEDERLLAHIKWFVMRRSGTDELRMMVAAVERLEVAD